MLRRRKQMICFRDQSFCAESAECANTECDRKWTDELAYQANRWWGGEGAPVAFMPMRETCGKFIKLGENK